MRPYYTSSIRQVVPPKLRVTLPDFFQTCGHLQLIVQRVWQNACNLQSLKEMCSRFVKGVDFTFLGNSIAFPQCNNYGLFQYMCNMLKRLFNNTSRNTGFFNNNYKF